MNNATPAGRRYIRRFIPLIMAYVVTLFAATWAVRVSQPGGALLVLLSALPAMPLVGVIAVLGVYLTDEKDEYLRSRIARHMLIGTGGLLCVTTVWGFLEFGKIVPHFPTMLAFPIWCGFWGLSQCLTALRNRRSGDGA